MIRSKLYDAYRVALLLLYLARWFLPFGFRRLLGRQHEANDFGRRLRMLVERMGVTYIKFGQYLSIRNDLLSPETCIELSKLLSDVRYVSFRVVQQLVEKELGAPLDSLFRQFEPEPIAAASVAQVYRAVARDGAVLAVKVQRPGVEQELRADLRNLRRLASLLAYLSPGGGRSLVKVVDEIGEFTLREIDFLREADTADRVRRESPSYVRIPEIRWDLTTAAVLSMEFIEGVTLLEICEAAERGETRIFENLVPGVNLEEVIHRMAQACLTQQFITGRFHGDPHPANVMIDQQGRVVFLDFGIFGEISLAQRIVLAKYTINIATGRVEEAYRHYEQLLTYGPDSDVTEFRNETIKTLRRWFELSSDRNTIATEKLVARFQMEQFATIRRYHVRMQPDQVLFWRTQAVLDATAHRLPIAFDMLKALREFLQSRPAIEALGFDKASDREIWQSLARSGRLLTRLAAFPHGLLSTSGSIPQLRVESRLSQDKGTYRTPAVKALGAAAVGAGLAAAASMAAAFDSGVTTLLISSAAFVILIWSLRAQD